MKKLSNKRRKLNFIRTKNNLLSGKIHGYTIFKISEVIVDDKELIDSEIEYGWKSIKKKWKLKRDYIDKATEVGKVDDDFHKKIWTVKVKYFLVKKT